MDTKKMGKFLASLRKELGVTQEQVAYALMTSRENVSKWERGVNTPTAESLILLGKYYDVSVNEILMGERKTEENKEQLENMTVEVMKVGEKKMKVVIKNFITIISLMVVVFLIYYFFNTYNTIRVYKVGGDSDNFFIREGLAIFSKGKSYLRIGTIEPKNNSNYDSYEIFLKNGEKEESLFTSDDTNYTLLTSYGYGDKFSFSNIDDIEKDTYIRINHDGVEEVIKLNFERDMVNNFLVTNKENFIVDDKNSNNENNIQKLENYVKDNFKYNKEKDEYTLNENLNNVKYLISYSLASRALTIEENKNNIINIVQFNLNQDLFYFFNKNFETIYTYDFDDNECLNGECNEEQINYYLENFFYKYVK